MILLMKNYLPKSYLLSLLLLVPFVALAASLSIQVSGKTVVLTDVSANAWFAADVKALSDAGIMQGYRDNQGIPTGKFGPADPVTRAQFLKMVAVMMVNRYDFDRSTVQTGDRWYAQYLAVVQSQDPQLPNIMPIDDTSLSQPILRNEAAGLLHLSLGNYNMTPPNDPKPFPDVNTDTPNFPAITELHVYGVISGDGKTGKFEPNRTLNRAEAAKMLVTTSSAYQAPLGIPKTGDPKFDSKEGCEAAGGTWRRWPSFNWDSCNFPTTDGGKKCTDILNRGITSPEDMVQQCQGDCISEDHRATSGTCSEWQQTYSDHCIAVLRESKAFPGPGCSTQQSYSWPD